MGGFWSCLRRPKFSIPSQMFGRDVQKSKSEMNGGTKRPLLETTRASFRPINVVLEPAVTRAANAVRNSLHQGYCA